MNKVALKLVTLRGVFHSLHHSPQGVFSRKSLAVGQAEHMQPWRWGRLCPCRVDRPWFCGLWLGALCALLMSMAAPVVAKSPEPAAPAVNAAGSGGKPLWIVELQAPGLMQRLSEQGQTMAQADRNSRGFKQQLAAVVDEVRNTRRQLALDLGQPLAAAHVYRVSISGFAAHMSAAEAAQLRAMSGVKAVHPDITYIPYLDAGPAWIGAPAIWQGPAGLRSQGEGVVMGVIDGGINWEHPFFADIGADGYNHTNPRGGQLGLCSQPIVACNDKLIGVYDFTNEGTSGRDTSNHGSHVASIAVGNHLNFSLALPGGSSSFMVSGVAPHANLITYKVCESSAAGDDPGSCSSAAILAALEQAVLDQVDVINISLGTTAPLVQSPWLLSIPNAELVAREAGIVVVVAAGNLGAQEGTVSSSGHSPWVITAGNSTHNRLIGQQLTNLNGGDTPPPPTLTGAGSSGGTSVRRIVHAADFGFPLCGTGAAELRTGCTANDPNPLIGTSNPFAPGTFNGEIVVCDRGIYGRVEKGFNVMNAGAGGMILANTAAQGNEVVSDSHCLSSVHVDSQQGDALRAWVASGSNHSGRIVGTSRVLDERFADDIAVSSGRGPNPEIAGVVKPNLMAPGSNILGASSDPQSVVFLSGTSMASPHVAGSAALLLGVNPAWSPAQVQSVMETTAAHQAIQENGGPAPINSRGAGLVQLDQAINAGLYLNISANDFRNQDPRQGDPTRLNLALMQHPDCFQSCQFTRRVTDMQGGGTWRVRVEGELPLTVSPGQFVLGNGQSRDLQIQATTGDPDLIGRWVEGVVVLESPGAPVQRLQVTVFASGGQLPELVQIQTSQTRGRQNLALNGLAAISLGNWDAGSLTPGELRTFSNVQQDATRQDPFDSPAGTVWALHQVGADTAYLLAQVNQANASDIDLYVGRDDDGDGVPSSTEVRCASTSISVFERCLVQQPEPGTYWVLYQNWDGGGAASSNIFTETALVAGTGSGNFFVNGPGVVNSAQSFNLELAWDEGRMQRNSSWWSALTLGTDDRHPGNLGVIPVRIVRSGDGVSATLPLFNGQPRDVALSANGEHDRLFIDVPPNATRLHIEMTAASGELQAVRVPFAEAFSEEPFAGPAPAQRPFSQAVAQGRAIVDIGAGMLAPGRWYVVPRNTGGQELNARVTASLTLGVPAFTVERTGYGPISRDVSQGIEFNRVGNRFGAAFFTYAENGAPVTYLGAGNLGPANTTVVHGPLNAFVGIPGAQQAMPVGQIGMTFLAADEVIVSYDLMGRSGSEHLGTLARLSCPQQGGQPLNVNGHWTAQTQGGGGTALLVNQTNQAYVFYFFDNQGIQRWLLANSAADYLTNPVATARQFRGFCPTCTPTAAGQAIVGTITHNFADDDSGEQTVGVNLVQPLSGSLQFSRPLFKLTDTNVCQ